MNDDTIQDLKQFIAATISQQVAEVTECLDKIENKIDDLSQFVAEAMESASEATDSQLRQHDQRLSQLERGAA